MKGIVILFISVFSLLLTDCAAGNVNNAGTEPAAEVDSIVSQKDNAEQTVLVREGKRIGMSDEGWYSKDYSDVITDKKLKDCPDILDQLDKVNAKAVQLRSVEMIGWEWYVEDYGTDYLYLPYTDEKGNTDRILLCEFGSECSWLDDDDVQKLVSLLIENGYFGDETIFEGYLTYEKKQN